MKDILPEVKAYWEKQGWEVKPRVPLQSGFTCVPFDIVKNGIVERSIALVFEDENRETVYYMGSQAFYGVDILKVLKLKAFL